MTRKQGENLVYISWAPHCSRSDNTARELGGVSYMVYAGWLGSSSFTVLLKYFLQTWSTFWILLRTRPSIVFVMSPPFVAAIPALFYTTCFGKGFVIDAHTGAFLNPRWRHFQWLQKKLCQKALATIVTNQYLSELVEKGGGRSVVIRDVPISYEDAEPYPRDAGFCVAFVTSFDIDEPIEEFLGAARDIGDVTFYVTGDSGKLGKKATSQIPENVNFTGFLPDAKFGALISSVDAVLCLTTQDHAMLRGGYEAIYQGTPVIVSDWKLLRETFDEGAVHVKNTAEGIVEGIQKMRANLNVYQNGAARLQKRKREEWSKRKDELDAVIAQTTKSQ